MLMMTMMKIRLRDKKNVMLLISQIKVERSFNLLSSTSICDDYNK